MSESRGTEHGPVPNVHSCTKSLRGAEHRQWYFPGCASFCFSALSSFHEEYAWFSFTEKKEPELSFTNCKSSYENTENTNQAERWEETKTFPSPAKWPLTLEVPLLTFW